MNKKITPIGNNAYVVESINDDNTDEYKSFLEEYANEEDPYKHLSDGPCPRYDSNAITPCNAREASLINSLRNRYEKALYPIVRDSRESEKDLPMGAVIANETRRNTNAIMASVLTNEFNKLICSLLEYNTQLISDASEDALRREFHEEDNKF